MSTPRLTRLIRVMRRTEPVSDFEADHGYVGQVVVLAYAEIRQMSDAERYYAEQVVASAEWRITIRFPAQPIKTTDWIEVDTAEGVKRFSIEGIKDPDNRGVWCEITCSLDHSEIGGDTFR